MSYSRKNVYSTCSPPYSIGCVLYVDGKGKTKAPAGYYKVGLYIYTVDSNGQVTASQYCDYSFYTQGTTGATGGSISLLSEDYLPPYLPNQAQPNKLSFPIPSISSGSANNIASPVMSETKMWLTDNTNATTTGPVVKEYNITYQPTAWTLTYVRSTVGYNKNPYKAMVSRLLEPPYGTGYNLFYAVPDSGFYNIIAKADPTDPSTFNTIYQWTMPSYGVQKANIVANGMAYSPTTNQYYIIWQTLITTGVYELVIGIFDLGGTLIYSRPIFRGSLSDMTNVSNNLPITGLVFYRGYLLMFRPYYPANDPANGIYYTKSVLDPYTLWEVEEVGDSTWRPIKWFTQPAQYRTLTPPTARECFTLLWNGQQNFGLTPFIYSDNYIPIPDVPWARPITTEQPTVFLGFAKAYFPISGNFDWPLTSSPNNYATGMPYGGAWSGNKLWLAMHAANDGPNSSTFFPFIKEYDITYQPNYFKATAYQEYYFETGITGNRPIQAMTVRSFTSPIPGKYWVISPQEGVSGQGPLTPYGRASILQYRLYKCPITGPFTNWNTTLFDLPQHLVPGGLGPQYSSIWRNNLAYSPTTDRYYMIYVWDISYNTGESSLRLGVFGPDGTLYQDRELTTRPAYQGYYNNDYYGIGFQDGDLIVYTSVTTSGIVYKVRINPATLDFRTPSYLCSETPSGLANKLECSTLIIPVRGNLNLFANTTLACAAFNWNSSSDYYSNKDLFVVGSTFIYEDPGLTVPLSTGSQWKPMSYNGTAIYAIQTGATGMVTSASLCVPPTTTTTSTTTLPPYYLMQGPAGGLANTVTLACANYGSPPYTPYYATTPTIATNITLIYLDSAKTQPLSTGVLFKPLAYASGYPVYAVQTEASGLVIAYQVCGGVTTTTTTIGPSYALPDIQFSNTNNGGYCNEPFTIVYVNQTDYDSYVAAGYSLVYGMILYSDSLLRYTISGYIIVYDGVVPRNFSYGTVLSTGGITPCIV